MVSGYDAVIYMGFQFFHPPQRIDCTWKYMPHGLKVRLLWKTEMPRVDISVLLLQHGAFRLVWQWHNLHIKWYIHFT